MQLTCAQENLVKGIAAASRASSSKSSLPSTTHLHLETNDGMLKLTGTDLTTTITTWIPCLTTKEGAVTVPARLLSDYVGSISADTVELSVPPDNHTLHITAGRSKTTINGGAPADFPPKPNLDGDPNAITITLKAPLLRQAIQKIVMAAATEENRPVLTGVSMRLKPGRFTLAAADGFRLAVHADDTEHQSEAVPVNADGDNSDSTEIIVPAKSMTELTRILGNADHYVYLTAARNRGQAVFKVDSPERVELISSLIQGAFPNYEALIPKNAGTTFSVDSAAIHRAVRTAAIFARDGSHIIRLKYGRTPEGHPHMVLSASSEEVGRIVEQLPLADIDGEPGHIAFNHRFLQDAIASSGPGLVTFEVSSPSDPGLIHPKDADNSLHVIMPMFVQWDPEEPEIADDPIHDSLAAHPPIDYSQAYDETPEQQEQEQEHEQEQEQVQVQADEGQDDPMDDPIPPEGYDPSHGDVAAQNGHHTENDAPEYVSVEELEAELQPVAAEPF